MSKANPFVYTELHTTDPERTRTFYRELFAWGLEVQDTPMGEYTMIDTGDGVNAGLRQSGNGGSHWLPYVSVDDLADSLRRARELGATVTVEPTEIPEGTFAVLVDPAGATLGVWQPKG